MACRYYRRLAYGQLAEELIFDFRLNPRLQVHAEVATIGKIDAAVHKTKAVGWADDSITPAI